jgi:hypothetical protein
VICIPGVFAIGGFAVLIMGLLKSSGAYTAAVARAIAAPAVIDALGTPIKEGFFVTGNISVKGVKRTSGKAELSIPITGPKADATI